MLWYGFKRTSSLHRRSKNTRHRNNVRDQRMARALPRRYSFPILTTSVQLPLGFNFVLLTRKEKDTRPCVVYLYDNTYYATLSFSQNLRAFYYSKDTSSFFFDTSSFSYVYRSHFKLVTTLLSKVTRPLFLKIRFRGKGYYMYKNRRNTIAPQMGYAHRVYVYASAVSVKFLSKTKILLFGFKPSDLFNVGYGLLAVRPMNIFTGRGVRFARQIVYRKTGKISSYR
jgi:hypothetical protein